MIKHRWREIAKSFGNPINPEKAEELKRTKTGIEHNLTKVLKLIKNEDQSKKDGNAKDYRKETELVGLIEDFYKQYQSLYTLYDRLTGEYGKLVPRGIHRCASLSSSGSDSEYFSSEELDSIINRRSIEIEYQNSSDTTKQEVEIGNAEVFNKNMKSNSDKKRRDHSALAKANDVLDTQGSAQVKELEEQLNLKKKELERLSKQIRALEVQVESKTTEAKQLSPNNTGLHARILELELLLKEKAGEAAGLQTILKNNENHAMSNIAELKAQIKNLEEEAKALRTQKDEIKGKITSDKNEAFNQMKGLTKKLNAMQQNLDSLHNQNKELEAKMERNREEASQHLIHIEDLQGKLAEKTSFEQKMLGEKERFIERIKDLELEVESRSNQTEELEEQLRGKGYEIDQLTEEKMKGLTKKLNAMQQNLDSLHNQNKELEAKMERNREEASQHLIHIEDLQGKLAEKTSFEQKMLGEKERFIERIKDLELEVESRSNQTEELEEQLRGKGYEIDQLTEEKKSLQDRNVELKRTLQQSREELSALMKELESVKYGASTQAMALTTEVNDLRVELDSLQEQKSKLEIENERGEKEYSESLAKMENLNCKLSSKIADQEKIIKEQAETVKQINGEYKQAKILSKNFKLNLQFTERRMEELTEEFRKKAEDNIRLLSRRIHVAEQLHNENKDGYKLTRERYKQEIRKLEDKIASFEDEVRKRRVTKVTPEEVQNGLNLGALDFDAAKLQAQTEHYLSRISKIMSDVQLAKDWIKRRKVEIEKLKDKVDCLTNLLDDREAQEILLREKVCKLEARVSKEGGEKLNLTKAVSQLEKRVGKLEKKLKEKDEELINVGEKKREAIRQLCFLVDYHRNRCDYLKDLITKMRVSNRASA